MTVLKKIIFRGICRTIAVLLVLFLFPAGGNAKDEDALTIIRNIRQFEAKEIRYDDRLEGDYFGYVKGSIPILISAPHGAKHYRTRKGFWKKEDAYTAGIAVELGRLTGAHVLYVKCKAPEDPNNDVHTKYKDFLQEVVKGSGIKFIIDLHGAGADRPFKVDVGILDDRVEMSSCPGYRAIIQNALRNFEEKPFNQVFRAGDPGTVTYFSRRTLGIEAAQIELNARYRVPDSPANEKNLFEVMTRLQTMIREINNKLQNSSAGISDCDSFAMYPYFLFT